MKEFLKNILFGFPIFLLAIGICFIIIITAFYFPVIFFPILFAFLIFGLCNELGKNFRAKLKEKQGNKK